MSLNAFKLKIDLICTIFHLERFLKANTFIFYNGVGGPAHAVKIFSENFLKITFLIFTEINIDTL